MKHIRSKRTVAVVTTFDTRFLELLLPFVDARFPTDNTRFSL
jgi:hypothetical protein